MAEVLARNAGMVLSAMASVLTARGQVHDAIVALLPRELPGTTAVARALAMSTRTLRRRFAADGLTFEGVPDQVVEAIARERLRDPLQSIAQVAYVLGFSEVRAFHRAFVRWTGITPGQFRSPLRR